MVLQQKFMNTIIHMNRISYDEGETWEEVKGNGILVLEPGAGTFYNQEAYKSLVDFNHKKDIITFG